MKNVLHANNSILNNKTFMQSKTIKKLWEET